MKPFSSLVPGTKSTLKPAAPATRIRVLDANAYDALEFVAEMFGGIGGGSYGDTEKYPCCGYGCAYFAEGPVVGSVSGALARAGITTSTNDEAVRAINRRLGVVPISSRVPFELWRQQLGIVRGPQPLPSPDATWAEAA